MISSAPPPGTLSAGLLTLAPATVEVTLAAAPSPPPSAVILCPRLGFAIEFCASAVKGIEIQHEQEK